ncbi:MAG TPA: NAD(P)/FAD-dependent oxidoreductase [Pusillimonas sp.]|uniref:NAD(P)/FAD-dependent oxidoreductase n=1 Tax=Pusillimonas sp. TaxID=3040095 RepID=UPI002C39C431|nr:NAD(P)/FAD-dependent oxidoreductase [Pusillimonas sp.]HUH87441.1 NAD(P)/FAD-dependent oxidoreductase [Pusillimonas sp.]
MQDNNIYDAIIIGAGAAGSSCTVWLARLGFSPLLIEAGPQVGGLCLVHPFADDWNASLPAHTGPQVAQNFAVSLQRAKVPVLLSQPVTAVETDGSHGFAVTTRSGPPRRGRYLVLATGTRARGLQDAQPGHAVPTGSRERPYPGVLVGPGDHVVAEDFAGRRVAVLGGGDNGFENALYAKEHGAAQVHLYARNIRAQHQFVQRMPAEQVFQGDYTVDPQARSVNGCAYDLILVFYGWEPSVPFAHNLSLARCERGYLKTDMATAQTSFEGVYAIGEVAHRLHPCVVTGMADGVTAAKAIQARIESGSHPSR